MKLVTFLLILSSVFLSGCGSIFANSPADLESKKKLFAEYTTNYEMTETFDCLARWIGTRVPWSLRREIADNGLKGHLFHKTYAPQGQGWIDWTVLFQQAKSGNANTLSIYKSANVLGGLGFLKDSASACVADVSSWPDSDF
jgi:uncharacterized protein YceK